MRLQVLHETHYTYSSPVQAVAMEARLQPCNDDYQFTQRYRLIILPKPQIEEYSTFSDLHVHYWTMLKATEITVISESVVDIRERPLATIHVSPLVPDPIDFYPYLQQTPLTRSTPEILEFASQFAELAAQDWYAAVVKIRQIIHQSIKFTKGMTTTESTATDVLRIGAGVCQDFTHLMLAVVRALGIPARYASGYLNQAISQEARQKQIMLNPMAMQIQEMHSDNGLLERMAHNTLRGTGASHAWCEVYFGPEYGWRGFDAANNLLVDQNFIRIGAGRDFTDITPVKGVHKGQAEEDLKVTVTVSQLA